MTQAGLVTADPILRELPDLAATFRLAQAVAALLRPGDAVLLEGPLGAGKSEFARHLLRTLTGDPALDVPSPSYSLVQDYDSPIGVIHHFDLWRLDGWAPLAELGWEDAQRGVVVVEWADRLGPLRPADALGIVLRLTGETARIAALSGWPGRLAQLA